jgi:muramoyltetrapeptide carboxypeptidase
MRYPKKLQKGDTIGLIGISGALRPTSAARVAEIAGRVEALGFRVKLDESVGQVYGYLSGTDEMRAGAVNRMFADETVDAIWAVRGGYGVTRILDRLDYDMIRSNAKPLIGYSDITALHAQLQTRCGMVSFHGPMPSADGLAPGSPNALSLLDAINTRPLGRVVNMDGSPLYGFNGGSAQGEMVGGNLSLVASLCGTPYALDARGKILFLEDVGEKTYALDRMFTQLRNAGYFDACAGVVLGGFSDCPVEDEEYGCTLEEILADVVLPCKKPVSTGLQAGHLAEKLTLPLGATALIDAEKRSLEFVG